MNCTEIKESENIKDIFVLISLSVFKENYFRERNCNFIECLRYGDKTEKFTVLFSKESHKFFGDSITYFIFAAIILGSFLAYFSYTPSQICRSFGWSFFLLGLPFVIIEFLKNKSVVVVSEKPIFSAVTNRLFESIRNYLFFSFVLGAVLIIVGYGITYLEKKWKK